MAESSDVLHRTQLPSEPRASLLLIDDNPTNLLALRAILEDLGHQLVDANSGEEALEKAKERDFAVFLLDVMMPGIGGFETAKRLRAEESSRYTPIIFLTARDVGREELEEAYSLGAVDFLVKPVLPVILQAKVRGFVELYKEKWRAQREAEQLRLLVQGTTDYAIFMLDPTGHVITWNSGAERLKGYRAEEIIGQHFSRFYPEEAKESQWPQYELQMASLEGRFEDEGWRLRQDGSRFWASVVITALRDSKQNLRGFSKITRDMTERKRAEENARKLLEETTARRVAEENARIIQEQRERLEVTLSSIGDGVISTDGQGRVSFLNKVAEKLIGWRREEARDIPLPDVFQIVNESTRLPVENPALRALRDGRIVGLANHTVLISKNGEERPINDSAAPIRDAKGNVIGTVLVFRDITEEKKAEQYRDLHLAVTHSLSQAQSVDEGARAVIKSVCEVLNWDLGLFWSATKDGSLHCNVSWHLPGASVDAFEKDCRERTFAVGEGLPGKVWATGQPAWHSDVQQEMLLPRADLAVRDGLHSAFAFPIAMGDQVIGLIEFFTKRIAEPDAPLMKNLSTVAAHVGEFIERRRAEEELRAADRRKDEFLATLAHELRNPLAPIRNAVQIFKIPNVDPATAQQAREIMERQLQHLVRLVDDLLDVSRVMRGKIELRKERVELADIITRAVETAQPLIHLQQHQLQLMIPNESLLVDADPIRLAQVLSNLLTNSAKYTESGGQIWLTADRNGDHAVLRVRDNGIGISVDMLPQIFELFVQAEHVSAKAQGGLGIGLTLVKNLVEMHGGSVEAHSEGLGEGSEFVVRLPLIRDFVRSEEIAQDLETANESKTGGYRLLVVDDNEDAAVSLSLLLQLQGHQIEIAHDGAQALEKAAAFLPELIFLDIGMPAMDGFEVARRVRTIPGLERTMLVALTGWGQREDRRRTSAAGFDYHLVKPPDPKALDLLMEKLRRG